MQQVNQDNAVVLLPHVLQYCMAMMHALFLSVISVPCLLWVLSFFCLAAPDAVVSLAANVADRAPAPYATLSRSCKHAVP